VSDNINIKIIKDLGDKDNFYLECNSKKNNRCSIEKFIDLALTLFFKRQQHRKLNWLDKDSDKDQSQFDELFN
jgi:hypothetical protein